MEYYNEYFLPPIGIKSQAFCYTVYYKNFMKIAKTIVSSIKLYDQFCFEFLFFMRNTIRTAFGDLSHLS